VIAPRDDSFHVPTTRDPDWNETFWFSFAVPERRLSGTLYPVFRRNLGTVGCCIAIWDDGAALPWEALYYDYRFWMPWPQGDLTRFELANGYAAECTSPLAEYQLRYAHPGALEFELLFSALIPPHETEMRDLAFAGAAHWDQHGRITGRLCLRGEEIAVDSIYMRDRSWGPRPAARGPRRVGYTTGFHASVGFHVISSAGDMLSELPKETVFQGYLWRDGAVADVVAGERRVVERDPRSGWPARVEIEIRDALGRTLETEGRCENRLAFPALPGNFNWMSLTRWSLDGAEAWGEDQDVWSVESWRAFAAARRGR
jgi:hypothetical protein